MDDSDDDRYGSTPRSFVPVAPKKRLGWLSCVKKQTSDENPLFVNKVGASPSDLAHSRVSRSMSACRGTFCSRGVASGALTLLVGSITAIF